ncbi:uncharacterized protein LOC117315368 [Pecten maximus]|uniref:uncharacterized protein LOC117315368 n=1 Tax=Pecten maximus TaxID=6579 RepID=UPI0014583D5B|nr:uncharacterized protein LOC117315368 [Pecten maximus]
MQISGHKNVQSINAYSTLNSQQQRTISNMLSSDYGSSASCPVIPSAMNTETTRVTSSTMTSAMTVGQHSTSISRKPADTRLPCGVLNGQIFGGTFNITVNNNYIAAKSRKRPIIESDSD